MYYNEEFDFGELLAKVGEDIIKESEEIEFVTCIPYTDLKDHIAIPGSIETSELPNDIELTNEGERITTDHAAYGRISIIASRKGVTSIRKVKMHRDDINEKFYKFRKTPRIMNVGNEIDELEARKQILCSSSPKSIIYLQSAEDVIIGEDWVVLIISDKEPIIIKRNFEEEEYSELVDSEISQALSRYNSAIYNKTKPIRR